MPNPNLARWYAYTRSHDHAALWEMIDPDAVFESPVVHTPQRGREIVHKYLAAADVVLGGAGFAYVGEWLAEDSAVLEFTTTIDGIAINGVDIIRWNADGRIVQFKVMVRPLKAVNMLHAKMGEMLARG